MAQMVVKEAQVRLPTSPMQSVDRNLGFTLIETLAVMLIIALVASLAFTITPGTGRAKLKSLSLEIAALLRRERLSSILSGRDRRISLDGERRALVGEDGKFVALPADVAMDLLGEDQSRSGNVGLRFFPNGASSGGVLRVSREGAKYEIRINWYTGAVSIDPP